MKILFAGLMMTLMTAVVLVVSPESAWAGPAVKSYREWKSSKIHEVEGRLQVAKTRREVRRTDPNLARVSGLEGRDPGSQKLELQIRNEEMALEMARELTVSDYFAGYLTKLSDKNSAFKDVAGRLSAEEVAELMSAYANSVFGTQTGNLPSSAQNVAPEMVK